MPGYDELVASAAAAPDAGIALRGKLADLTGGRRFETVLDLVRARAAEVLGYTDVELVGEEKAFRDLGFDSLGAVELRNQLNAATGLSLTSTLVFDHPTPVALAEHILAGLLPDGGGEDEAGDGNLLGDGDEIDVRALLGSVSLEQMREIGVLEPLLRLAGRAAAGGGTEQGTGDSIDTMAVDDLVQAALNGQSDRSYD
jgi:KS-AT-KR-ACP domain-containing polyene macrolide polyketide synthase/pimaricinolide synthase PimS2/candicidin polyketide synthase FscD